MGFWKDIFGANEGSGQKAKNRLKIVLAHDRTDISPELMDALRQDMIAVLAKYMDIDTGKIKVDLDRKDQPMAFVANIPVLQVKRGSWIQQTGDAFDDV